MRPALKPALRRLWRDPATLQLGLDADRAVVVGGLAPAAARLLESLDGTRETDELLQGTRSHGVDPATVSALLALLTDSGAVEDAAADRRVLRELPGLDRERLAPDLAALSLARRASDGGAGALRSRLARTVRVHGAGRVGAGVAALLAAAGVGRVEVEDAGPVRPGDLSPGGHPPTRLGYRRGPAAEQSAALWTSRPAPPPAAPSQPAGPRGRRPAAGRAGDPATRAAPAPGMRLPDLAVLAPALSPAPHLVEALVRDGVPHLLVAVRETTAVVGPLVLPGRSACLRCLDLHRTDRDPAWPRLAAQLAAPAAPPVDSCDVALAALAAASACLQALAYLDGDEAPAVRDGALETALPAGRTRRRSWSVHPACGCGWQPGTEAAR
ncbi:thiamine biosynthesis protein ThiF [Motilibacter aurantiacus]|uniref:thiamine biosynthesis protein ThiF n=1 Tax=Motilibacter aurantiacus TaxID=2714955 RepID=UPI00140DD1A9|nr:thiamine biosynthesis protein ThiF [Motilibacter aurantiacus]NHC45648.1 thiamine biosynthesis protein ThiF [Motilibacter aurantiacus]